MSASEFICELQSFSSERVFNPYRDVCPDWDRADAAVSASAIALRIEVAASDASPAFEIAGSSKRTGLSFRGGAFRSRHRRSAVVSPESARSTAFLVSASASPSRRASAASVALCRAPFGLPGFPRANLPFSSVYVFGSFFRWFILRSSHCRKDHGRCLGGSASPRMRWLIDMHH